MKWHLIFVRKLLVYVKISWNSRVVKGIHPVCLYFIHAKTIHTKFWCYENRKKKMLMKLILIFIDWLFIFYQFFFSGNIMDFFPHHITAQCSDVQLRMLHIQVCIFTLSNTGCFMAKYSKVNKYSFQGNYSFLNLWNVKNFK